MDCWYPITVSRHLNVKLKSGVVATHKYGKMVVPCGRCPACRRRKQNEWAFRILEEAKYTKSCYFVTLTYNDDFLPFSDLGVPTLVPHHLTSFFKNLRYDIGSFRYFACGEYGDQFDRPHYHFILFYNGNFSDDFVKSSIEKRWSGGFTQVENGITDRRAKYCAKYSMKQVGFDYGDCVPPFARMSRRPGLGKQFLNQFPIEKLRKLDQWFVNDYRGTPYNLPRYYREAIYSKDECLQHSMLLEKLKNSKLDCEIINFSDNNVGSYFQSEMDRLLNNERLFIKHLKKENYGFKFKQFRKSKDEVYKYPKDDLCSDEF